jgi:DHA1 family multidrug resistance protein B-like MFS transporter
VRLLAAVAMAWACSPWWDAPVVVWLMMTVNAVCSGLTRPAGEALIVDISTPENRKFMYSLDYWFWNASVFVGSIGGSFLFLQHRFELLLVVAFLALVSLVLLKYFIVDPYVPKPNLEPKGSLLKEMVKNYRVVGRDTVFKLFLLATTMEMAIQFQSQNFTPVRLTQEFSTQTLLALGGFTFRVDGLQLYGVLNSVNTVLVIVLGLFVGHFVKKYRDRTVLFSGIALYTLGYAVLASSNHAWLLVLMIVVLTVGELLIIPVKQAMLADLVPEDRRGSYFAINGLTFRGASILGSLALTLGGYVPSWVIGAEMGLLGLGSLLLFGKVMGSHQERGVELGSVRV